MYACMCPCSVSVDVEHYINEKSLRQRLTLLSLSNGKIGRYRCASSTGHMHVASHSCLCSLLVQVRFSGVVLL